jgi:ankyrin repeat protein
MFANRLNKKLIKAVLNQDIAAARECLEKGANIEAMSEDDFTPLLLAAKGDFTGIAKLLIEKGANVHQATKYGDSALHWAAKNNNVAIAKQLIENLADINQLNNRNSSPLMVCAIFCSLEVGKLLLEKGARTDIVLEKEPRHDAMQIARQRNHTRFEMLLALHAVGDRPTWEITGGESISRSSRLNAETMLTEHFDFAAKMYTSIVNGPDGAPSHSRTGFNSVAKPLLAEARHMLRALAAKGP